MDESSEGSTLYTQNSNIKNTKNCNFLPETVPNSDRNGNLNSDQSNVESSVKLVKNHTEAFSDSDSGSDKPFSFIVCSKDVSNGTKSNQNMDSDSNDNTTVFKSKTNKLRILNISSDEDNTPETNGKPKFTHTSDSSDSDHDDDNTEISKYQRKSRIKNISSSDEDSQPSSTEHTDNIERSALKNCEQQARMKNRRNNIENKFKNLLSSRGKKSNVSLDEKTSVENTTVQNGKDDFSNDSSDGSEDLEMKTIKQKIKDRNESLKSTLYDPDTSDEDGNPRRNISQMVQKSSKPKQKRNNNSNPDGSGDEEISKIKQKIKERNKTLKTTICDPDTSDEEEVHRQKTPNAKSVRKSTKMISPQPMRMSAKQAMENMQKIKSESNRMLREKEVSLPYHRPKALSLKDIMSRRKPALSSDGKALPIKMNDEQLRQYAQQLEQRQKEMMELCKSDTEDEETPENDPKPNVDVSTDVADDKSPIEVVENCNEYDNDISFDEVNLNLKDKHKPEESNTKNDPSEIEEIKNDLELNDVANKDVLNNESSTTENENENEIIENDTNTLNIEESCLEESNTKNDPSEIEDIKNDLELNDVTNKDVLNNEPSTTENENKIIENDTNTLNIDESCHGQETLDVQNCRNEETISKISDMVIDAVASNTELDSQLISLNYDSEKLESNNEIVKKTTKNLEKEAITVGEETNICIENENENNSNEINSGVNKYLFEDDNDLFDNDDIDMEDIDRLIENAEIINTTNGQAVNSPMLVREPPNLNSKPKLAGAPGMVIDLDGTDAARPKKLSGVELLKERFSYFATLKTPEEIERIREKKIKPGTQHSKLKQELEEQMAEQRSLEWAKRLEDDKQQRQELSALRGDQSEEDDIEKIEAKLAETEADIEGDESSSESEEEPEENDVIIKDKPAAKNSLICYEAEESDCDEETGNISAANEKSEENDEGVENDDDSDEEPSSEESSEDEYENDDDKPKKSRILKAFEDSDEEDAAKVTNDEAMSVCNENNDNEKDKNLDNVTNTATQITQDDEIPSAQLQKSFSEDLFASQDNDAQLTSSIEKPNKSQVKTIQAQQKNEEKMSDGNNLAVISETQPYDDAKFDDIVGMCSGSFSQNIVNTQPQATQPMQTQELGDDVLALCTGKFYDNDFITQENDAQTEVGNQPTGTQEKEFTEKGQSITIEESSKDDSKKSDDRNLLRSIIDELDGPEFNEPKPNKFFNGNNNKEVQHNTVNHQKKRFVIDSDEEEKDPTQDVRKKKQKKKKLQDRALQISDDEEEESEDENEYENMSEPEEEAERVVEYDSEENEVEVQQPVQNKKKKRKVTEFFENEAELTSEDEYVGSGDEDERGLDRMEREEGDDDTFHQGRLQAELGQIHMRDVLDQDKREVRLIQELLFEDGDLGDGHRQRKFRWRNADGVEEIGAGLDEFGDTQEEEFESEEQWRKQRHEREVFLRTLMQNETGESDTSLNVSVSRTSIIKANLTSKTMSSLLMEVSSTEEKSSVEKDKVSTDKEKSDSPLMLEKRSSKDIPSPVKKPFSMMQQNYRGSILSRGSGALARLAALATPLAGDHNDNAPKMGSLAPGKRNFVFAAVSPKTEDKPKVSKRKGDSNAGTPQLMKKMKTDEKQGLVKTSLLDHLRV